MEEIQKVKPKKTDDKQIEEVHKMKQLKKVEGKPSEEIRQMQVTPKKQLELTRSMSTSALLDSPSALSLKVSFMSKKVKETLGKVMTGTLVSSNPVITVCVDRQLAVLLVIAYHFRFVLCESCHDQWSDRIHEMWQGVLEEYSKNQCCPPFILLRKRLSFRKGQAHCLPCRK